MSVKGREVLWLAVVFSAVVSVRCHGMLVDPPARSTMWRYGFDTPINYDDNALFCGGYTVQWDSNGGRCGLCGDDFRQTIPRPNEHGGQYGTGVIAARYSPGQLIRVRVRVTANHRGFFTFDLCPLRSSGRRSRGRKLDSKETEECFKRWPLKTSNGTNKYEVTDFRPRDFEVDLQLPQGLVAEHAVLRWTYTAGNNWGYCHDGSGRLGCGPQETFKTCSDISILPARNSTTSTTQRPLEANATSA